MAQENIKKILKEYQKETHRHFDVVTERLEGKMSIIAEQVATSTEDITIIKQDLHGVKDNIDIIKSDIEFIKHDLKQKISRDEFAVLEKRVRLLETKMR